MVDDSMAVELRRAGPADLARLQPLVAAYHHFEHIDINAERRKHALEFLLGEQEFGAIWLIHAAAQLAGYIVLCKGFSIEFGGYDAFIDEFFLSPQFRGRGIGKTVLERIAGEARRLGINALHLEVARGNDKARRLYRGAGFEARDKYLLMSLEFGE